MTISGLSAGAGSVMLQDIAYGGTLGTKLFSQVICFLLIPKSVLCAFQYLQTQLVYHSLPIPTTTIQLQRLPAYTSILRLRYRCKLSAYVPLRERLPNGLPMPRIPRLRNPAKSFKSNLIIWNIRVVGVSSSHRWNFYNRDT